MSNLPLIDVIDYGGGNIGSLIRCLERLEVPYQKIDSGDQLTGNNPVVLPGVGAFGATMANLESRKLSSKIQDITGKGVPFLGICVGLQVLFDESEESPGVSGLKLIHGTIKKFQSKKVPQIGWNYIQKANTHGPDTTDHGYVYFVNSYYAKPESPNTILYEAFYDIPFCAAVQQDNITAYQFHPEKSGLFGHQLVKGWVYANS